MTQSAFARWSISVALVLVVVIIPWLIWGEALSRWSIAFSRSESALWLQVAIFSGLLAADILLPVPSSFVAVAAGASLGAWLGTLVTTLGLSLGCVIGYVLGARAGRPGILRFVGATEVHRVDQFSARFGDAIVLLLRSVPVLAEASVVFAGATGVPFGRFMLWSTLANGVIAAMYAVAGNVSAESGNYEVAILVACALPFMGIVAARWARPKPGAEKCQRCAGLRTKAWRRISERRTAELSRASTRTRWLS